MKPQKNKTGIKSLFFALFTILFIFTLILPGCNQQPSQPEPALPPASVTTPGDIKEPGQTPNTSQNQPSAPASPFTLDLSFPSGAPALNQAVELKGIAQTHRYTPDIRIEVVLPESFELVGGNLTWSSTDMPRNIPIEVINAKIKATKTGNFTIEARTTLGKNIQEIGWGFEGGVGRDYIYVSVFEDTAEWGVGHPPWITPGPPTPIKRNQAPSSPLKVTLSMPKAPKMDEKIPLICELKSTIDAPNTFVTVKLPSDVTVSTGDLSWQGNLTANVTISFSAKLPFKKKANGEAQATGFITSETISLVDKCP